MSLVELALKKMQAAARPAGVSKRDARETPQPSSRLKPGAVGEIQRVDTPRIYDSPSGVSYRLDKIVRVDRAALRHEGLMPPEHQERVLADQYRQVKRPIIDNAIGRDAEPLVDGQLVMMASAMPGEGKTFTSVNLAFSIAMEKDVSVLLIDADVAKPHISRIFGVEQEPGLLDVLTDESLDIETVILPTDVPGLMLLPAGKQSEFAAELLSSHRMVETMRRLAARDRRRIALLDSPPLLLTSESRSLAQAVGQIVLVVRAGLTPQQAVLDAIGYLGEGKSIGLVLNQSIAATSAGSYYGYGDPARLAPTPD